MTILEEAIQAVTGPRAEAYGDFKENMERIASIASALLGEEVTARECVMILLAVKFGRLIHTPNHRDSIVDIAGYAEGLARVLDLDKGPERLELEVREVIRAPKCPNCACDFHLFGQDEDLLTDEALDHCQTLEQQRNAAADDAAGALDLVSRIREALGDHGLRMQDELLEYCRELAAREGR